MSADAARDDGQARARVVKRVAQKTDERCAASPDSTQRRKHRLAHRRAAKQRDRHHSQHYTQTKGTPALSTITHSAQVRLRARRDNLREVFGHLHARLICERVIQLAQQSPLRFQLSLTTRARRTVLFQSNERPGIKLAVEICGDLFSAANGCVRRCHAHDSNRVTKERRRLLRPRSIHHQTLVIPLSTNCWRITSRARKSLFLTVPSGKPVTSAISS